MSVPLPAFDNSCVAPDSTGNNLYVFGVSVKSGLGTLSAYKINSLSSLSSSTTAAPSSTIVSTTSSDANWQPTFGLSCNLFLGNGSSSINIQQFGAGSTSKSIQFYPNGTWSSPTIAAGYDFSSPKTFSLVGSLGTKSWFVAQYNPRAGQSTNWISMRKDTNSPDGFNFDNLGKVALPSNPLLTVGAITTSTSSQTNANGALFVFDNSGSSATFYHATNNQIPDVNITQAGQSIVTLDSSTPTAVNMGGYTITADAIPITASFAGFILDKDPISNSITVYSLDPRNNFRLTKMTAAAAPLFASKQSATVLSNLVVVYGPADPGSGSTNTPVIHTYNLITGIWSGPNLVDPTKPAAGGSSGSGGLNPAMIGGAAAGVIVLLALVGWIIYRRRKGAKWLPGSKNSKRGRQSVGGSEGESEEDEERRGFSKDKNNGHFQEDRMMREQMVIDGQASMSPRKAPQNPHTTTIKVNVSEDEAKKWEQEQAMLLLAAANQKSSSKKQQRYTQQIDPRVQHFMMQQQTNKQQQQHSVPLPYFQPSASAFSSPVTAPTPAFSNPSQFNMSRNQSFDYFTAPAIPGVTNVGQQTGSATSGSPSNSSSSRVAPGYSTTTGATTPTTPTSARSMPNSPSHHYKNSATPTAAVPQLPAAVTDFIQLKSVQLQQAKQARRQQRQQQREQQMKEGGGGLSRNPSQYKLEIRNEYDDAVPSHRQGSQSQLLNNGGSAGTNTGPVRNHTTNIVVNNNSNHMNSQGYPTTTSPTPPPMGATSLSLPAMSNSGSTHAGGANSQPSSLAPSPVFGSATSQSSLTGSTTPTPEHQQPYSQQQQSPRSRTNSTTTTSSLAYLVAPPPVPAAAATPFPNPGMLSTQIATVATRAPMDKRQYKSRRTKSDGLEDEVTPQSEYQQGKFLGTAGNSQSNMNDQNNRASAFYKVEYNSGSLQLPNSPNLATSTTAAILATDPLTSPTMSSSSSSNNYNNNNKTKSKSRKPRANTTPIAPINNNNNNNNTPDLGGNDEFSTTEEPLLESFFPAPPIHKNIYSHTHSPSPTPSSVSAVSSSSTPYSAFSASASEAAAAVVVAATASSLYGVSSSIGDKEELGTREPRKRTIVNPLQQQQQHQQGLLSSDESSSTLNPLPVKGRSAKRRVPTPPEDTPSHQQQQQYQESETGDQDLPSVNVLLPPKSPKSPHLTSLPRPIRKQQQQLLLQQQQMRYDEMMANNSHQQQQQQQQQSQYHS